MNRLLKIAHQRQLQKEQNRIIENASNEIFATKYKNEKVISEIMMHEFIDKVATEIAYLWHGERVQTFGDMIDNN